MAFRHCIWALSVLFAVPLAAQQPAPKPAPAPVTTTYGYTVFVGGTLVGREDVTTTSSADGITIAGKGRLSGSLDIVMERAEIKYRPNFTPQSYEFEATVNGGPAGLQTMFEGNTAVTRGSDGGQRVDTTDKIASPSQTIVLPNVFFGSYEALTRRLATSPVGEEFSGFVRAGNQVALRLSAASAERVQISTATFNVRRYTLTMSDAKGATTINLYADEKGALLRVSIPGIGLDVMREDLASSTARTVVYSNPGDEAVNIPATGFNLGATLTRPSSAAAAKLPAVILLSGAGIDDRDGVVGGVPVIGQIAGALANAGFFTVRYDKRGYGQSGGRAESATLADHAEDTLAVVRWLSNRPEIDRDRIAIIGHNEGAWTALLAANRERRIAGVATLAAPATTGAERTLEQQRHLLERMNLPPAELVSRIELQNRINAAVMSGRGWEGIPPDTRKQADTPWFQSLLTFDPSRVVKDLRQPLLIIHGELDAQVPVAHADRLAELGKTSRSRAVGIVTVRGINHLLIPAMTGEVDEYPSLEDRNVSKEVTTAISAWLTKTFASIR
ncbi:MAG: alpha/beta fold hydrolase [Acidobacteria bacterium]|nr:alpha/beta fold hydrolase [Acidobacteriota bacterium]